MRWIKDIPTKFDENNKEVPVDFDLEENQYLGPPFDYPPKNYEGHPAQWRGLYEDNDNIIEVLGEHRLMAGAAAQHNDYNAYAKALTHFCNCLNMHCFIHKSPLHFTQQVGVYKLKSDETSEQAMIPVVDDYYVWAVFPAKRNEKTLSEHPIRVRTAQGTWTILDFFKPSFDVVKLNNPENGDDMVSTEDSEDNTLITETAESESLQN